MHDFERILGVARRLRLIEAHLGQFALDGVDEVAVHRKASASRTAFGQRGEAGLLPFQMPQDVLQALFDAAEIAAAMTAGGFEALEQQRDPLFKMRQRRRRVMTDRELVEPIGQCAHRAFELLGISGGGRMLAGFESRGQRRNALFERSERISMTVKAPELVDFRRQHVEIVAETRQRVVRRDVGNDAAQRADGAFKLLHRAAVATAAYDGVDLGAEIADRIVEAGKLLGGLQRAQRIVDLVERALDVGKGLAVAAVLAAVLDAARKGADFILDRFDRMTRHRLGDGVANLGQLVAERGNRLLDCVGTPQRLDLAGDLEQLPFEAGKIRRRRQRGHGRSDRRRVTHRRGPRRIEFMLARGDFRDREFERGRIERRRRIVDFSGGAFDPVGAARRILLRRRRWWRRRRGDAGEPRIET